MTIQDRLSEIEGRANKATPSYWDWTYIYSGEVVISAGVNGQTTLGIMRDIEDAKFVASSRTDIPKLVKALRVAISSIQRQAHPHIELFCKDRAKEALTEIERILNAEGEG